RQSLATGQVEAADRALSAAGPSRDLPGDLPLELTLARGEVEEARRSWHAAFAAYDAARRLTHDRLDGLPADGGRQRFVADRLRGVQRMVELSRDRFMDVPRAFRI